MLQHHFKFPDENTDEQKPIIFEWKKCKTLSIYKENKVFPLLTTYYPKSHIANKTVKTNFKWHQQQ